MKYIGIDLAWKEGHVTGVCILEGKTCVFLEAQSYSNEELVRILLDNRPCIVSVDAPLVVKNETGGRSVDSLLMKTPIHDRYLKLYATSRNYMNRVFGSIRGEEILEPLKHEDFSLGKNIVETYPTGIFLSLFPHLFDHKYKLSSRLVLDELVNNSRQLIQEISKLGFEIPLVFEGRTKKSYKSFEDKLDSVMCALNSYYFHHEQTLLFFDDNGTLALPKK